MKIVGFHLELEFKVVILFQVQHCKVLVIIHAFRKNHRISLTFKNLKHINSLNLFPHEAVNLKKIIMLNPDHH